MEEQKAYPWLALLLFSAKKLAEQYAGRPEEQEFQTLIAWAESEMPAAGAAPADHEQGKLPPAPGEPETPPAA